MDCFWENVFFRSKLSAILFFFLFCEGVAKKRSARSGSDKFKEVLMEMMAIFPTNHLFATIEVERFGNFQICAKSVDTLSALFVVLQS